jgi:hypothetical protein
LGHFGYSIFAGLRFSAKRRYSRGGRTGFPVSSIFAETQKGRSMRPFFCGASRDRPEGRFRPGVAGPHQADLRHCRYLGMARAISANWPLISPRRDHSVNIDADCLGQYGELGLDTA